mgnify:CR=1 FL=1
MIQSRSVMEQIRPRNAIGVTVRRLSNPNLPSKYRIWCLMLASWKRELRQAAFAGLPSCQRCPPNGETDSPIVAGVLDGDEPTLSRALQSIGEDAGAGDFIRPDVVRDL